MTEEQTVVLDFGTATTKAGFAGDEKPKSVFATVIGNFKSNDLDFSKKDFDIGDCVLRKATNYIITHPIDHGIFTNFEDMEKLFHHTFDNELRFDPKDHSVLIVEPPKNPRYVREKQIEIMFETFNVSSFCVKPSPLLELYSSGRNCGVIVDIGEGITTVSPFYDGFLNIRGAKRQNFGGFDLNEYLEDLLQCEQGKSFNTSSDKEIVREIKEKHCYVALDYESELKKCKETKECESTYFFNDGNELKISIERFKCPEILFKPYLNGFEFKGIHNFVFDSIMKCDICTRADLYVNIIVSGGSSLMKGLPERLDSEMKKLVPQKVRSKIVANEGREIFAWIGGSILASLSTFKERSVSRQEYNETGKDIVNLKME